jgi:arginyl-tRNA synthetase
MSTEQLLQEKIQIVVEQLYGTKPNSAQLQIQKTSKEFEGDYTLVAFPLLRISKKNPEETAKEIGHYLAETCPEVVNFNVVKGFLNITLSNEYWAKTLNAIVADRDFGFKPQQSDETVVVEFSSPNTNKPLHLGHIRNNLLGFSIARILEKNGKRVVKVNLVNDRGIHICKSMIAWQKFGNGETPETAHKKGDHLVGEYYVRFDKEYKAQVAELVAKGIAEEEAKAKAPILLETQEMLRQWEAKNPSVYALWEKMNGWVYEGFDKTYTRLALHSTRFTTNRRPTSWEIDCE